MDRFFEGFPGILENIRDFLENSTIDFIFVRWEILEITGYIPISRLWGNYLEPNFFLVLGYLKFFIKYGENSIWGNSHKFPNNLPSLVPRRPLRIRPQLKYCISRDFLKSVNNRAKMAARLRRASKVFAIGTRWSSLRGGDEEDLCMTQRR